MDWLEILKYIAAIASGLAAAIPLVIQPGEGYEADGNCRD